MHLDMIPESARVAGLGVLMKGAGLLTRLMPIPQPTLLVGPGSSARLGKMIAGFGHEKVFIVTDATLVRLGLLTPLTEALELADTPYAVFDEVTPDAPIPLIERGLRAFNDHGCDALVAIGGGSAMDAAKAIAIASANRHKPLRKLAGYFKGLHAPPPVYAVPTTAGTGSEVTVAAVIADPERKTKLVIVDTRLVPKVAALDPELMIGLPPAITAATGMDALTHAIESFLGQWATEATDALALTAVGLIFGNLRTVYQRGDDMDAREKMALASAYAGMAFTRANVGYVHAIAHQFGGHYHTPHGLANAMVLPHVLRFSAPAVTGRLARLAIRAGLGEENQNEEVLADRFLEAVDTLNRDLGIPTTLDALREADVPALAAAALKEAHAGYPVPRYMGKADCEDLIRRLLPTQAPATGATGTARQTRPAATQRKKAPSTTERPIAATRTRRPAAAAPTSAPKEPAPAPGRRTRKQDN
jgi:alcohol dehydrogenase